MYGSRIREMRKRRGLTLKEVAEATGYTIGHISQIERACEKTKVFSCVLFLINTTVIIFHKKAYNPPSPMRMPL